MREQKLITADPYIHGARSFQQCMDAGGVSFLYPSTDAGQCRRWMACCMAWRGEMCIHFTGTPVDYNQLDREIKKSIREKNEELEDQGYDPISQEKREELR